MIESKNIEKGKKTEDERNESLRKKMSRNNLDKDEVKDDEKTKTKR